MGRDSATSLAPGFRFHPTDEELVRYYLRRKVCNKPFRFDHISVTDVYKSEPWDLPNKSKLKSRDLEWYFFSVLDKKYGNGSRTNRATERGYWKTTGKDRSVRHNSRTVGMKKTLVYHSGRAPRGERTNWVMHEYRLTDEDLEKAGIAQKSGTGPKNGEQYGAPFIEEEWDDEELAFVPGQDADAVADEVDEVDQKLDMSVPSENAPYLVNFYHGESSHNVEHSGEFSEDDQKLVLGMAEAQYNSDLHAACEFSESPVENVMDLKAVKNEYMVESSNNMNPADANCWVDGPYFDANANPPLNDGFYLEANDLSNPIEANSAGFDMLDDYLTFFDADDDIADYLTFDSPEILGNENSGLDQAPATQKLGNGEAEQESMPSQHISEVDGRNHASSSQQLPEAENFESDAKYPFMKQASRVLGSLPAPPAFASEFPSKDALLQLSSAAQSSSSLHVTAGMIRIADISGGTGVDWSFTKNGNVNVMLSFGVLQSNVVNSAASVRMASALSDKTGSLTWGWLFLMFFWVLLLSVSFKTGTYIYTR